MNVLLVEDETLVRRFIKSLIDWEKVGYTIVGEASNGEEAWKILESEPVDIVLTDIRMPVMNGFELIEQIYQKRMPCEVVILSSYDDFEYVRTALKLQVSDYVHKATISEEELIAALHKTKSDWARRQEQRLVDRMNRRIELSRRGLVAANLLSVALESEHDQAYSIKLSEQLQLWNEPFEVALACTAEAIAVSDIETENWIAFPLDKHWVIAGQQVVSMLSSRSDAVVVHSARRIRLEEWPLVYLELIAALEQRLHEQEAARSFHVSIQKAVEYLHSHYMNEITLEVMSDLVHISPAYFSRLFMKETGKTFIDYLTELRLSHAKSILSQSNLPVYDVAEQVGYRNTRYFSKLFKEALGMTPTEYRMQQSQDM